MPDGRCKQVFAALSEYLAGELPARDRRDLAKHFKGCKSCLAYLETLKATIKACRQHRVRKAPHPSPHVRRARPRAVFESRSPAVRRRGHPEVEEPPGLPH
jgi:anti-sigma factor RsiW